jgi:alkylhydroperoxidase family enzyme
LQDPNERLHQCLAQADLAGASLSQPEHALMELVRKVTLEAYKTTDEDIANLRFHGWTDPQIAEAVYITALFAFFNRVADAFGLEDPHYFDNPPPRGGDPAHPSASGEPPST